VRALARSARRIAIDHSKLEKVAGDALEAGVVKRALSGVDLVIQSLGVPAGLEIILKPMRFFSKATRVVVAAMEEAQVRRLISVTGFGAGDSRDHGGFFYNAAFHLLLGRVYDDKDVQEWIIRRSKLDWVIVQAECLVQFNPRLLGAFLVATLQLFKRPRPACLGDALSMALRILSHVTRCFRLERRPTEA
jgi:hypothetical protein